MRRSEWMLIAMIANVLHQARIGKEEKYLICTEFEKMLKQRYKNFDAVHFRYVILGFDGRYFSPEETKHLTKVPLPETIQEAE